MPYASGFYPRLYNTLIYCVQNIPANATVDDLKMVLSSGVSSRESTHKRSDSLVLFQPGQDTMSIRLIKQKTACYAFVTFEDRASGAFSFGSMAIS